MSQSALTALAKDELLGIDAAAADVRAAEAAALIRFGAELRPGPVGLAIVADFAEREVAQRLVSLLLSVCDVQASITTAPPTSSQREPRFEVLLGSGAVDVVRKLKLVTPAGNAVVGMPRHIISGNVAEVEGAWRGAFLARGSLTEPGRSTGLEVTSPCQEAALALVGLARRLSVSAKTKETRGVERVCLRDGEAIGVLLSRMGAHRARLEWDEKRAVLDAGVKTSQRLATFDDANTRRSAQAAAAAAARVERAMDILGDDVPEHLAEAGILRVEHRLASLEELGRLADPQMTKDAVAGRIRRLLSLADRRAAELGVPDTHAVDVEK
ncbi:Putative sporulation transcription regulator WhiA [Corynebacterium capitovis DSM 44611]|uniref:DNA-binding protein WhiA n=1 Tax=Corynebacterium capitovis TaxID=131081 RepID=UPI00037CE0B1|nr:DNA-binding protein WhiA [Corynebacterium capitovis]WKD57616.1 Putative sporulation transcription regulator WhiA [Corynebacterium capitovis DSM 44611]